MCDDADDFVWYYCPMCGSSTDTYSKYYCSCYDIDSNNDTDDKDLDQQG